MSQCQDFCFTWNNPPQDYQDTLHTVYMRHCAYMIFQLEIGNEAGMPHVQGYFELRNRSRFSTVRNYWADLGVESVHLETRKATQQQCIDYCSKQDTRVDESESGEWGVPRKSEQGRRNDIHEAAALVRDHGIKKLKQELPGLYVRYHAGLEKLARFYAEEEARPDMSDFVPRPWQKQLLEQLEQPADDRTIVWVYDAQGGAGKSKLARYLLCEKGAVILGGRVIDQSFMYDRQKIVIYDLTRTQTEQMDHIYSQAENLKNGVVVSTKYESCNKLFKPPHVIIFSNSMPDETKWSADRLKLINLANWREEEAELGMGFA